MTPAETAEAIIIVIKRLLKWALWALCIVLVIVLCVYAYVSAQKWYEERPRIAVALKDITLGDKLSDVMFRIPGFTKNDDLPLGEQTYSNNELRLYMTLRSGLVVDIRYYCRDFDLTSINGVSCEASGESIKSKFSDRLRILCRKDTSAENSTSHRIYEVVEFGVRYYMTSNKVVGILIASPKILEEYFGRNWIPCE